MPGLAHQNNCQLFGGALSCSLPSDFKDISTIRPVPDNQEVFMHFESGQSAIIELLELQEVPDDEAARYHFEQLGVTTEAAVTISSMEKLSDTAIPNIPNGVKYLIHGHHTLNESSQTVPNKVVDVYLLLVRLPQVTTDLLMLAHIPLSDEHAPVITKQMFSDCASTLNVHDWNLFG